MTRLATMPDRINGNGSHDPIADPLPHLLPQNRGKYNFGESIRSMLGHPGTGRAGKHPPCGLSKETSDEISRRTNRYPKGIWLPLDLMIPPVRALTTTTGAGAIPTIMEETQFIDALRAKMSLGLAGARITTLTDEKGKVALPRRSSTTQVAWVGEGVDTGGQQNLTSDNIVFAQHQVMAFTDVTVKMMDSAFPEFDAWVLDDISRAIGVEVDRVGLNGSGGASNQPVGLLQIPAVPVIGLAANGGPPTRAALITMEQTVGNNLGDASAAVSLGWIGTPNARAKMRSTDGAAAGTGKWLWEDNNTVLGSLAQATTNMPNNLTKGTGTGLSALAYGNWADLIINLFTAVDILINPYQWSTSGMIRLQAYLDCDVQLGHAQSFATVVDMATT